jgi:shikimate dehydrogenase
MTDRYAVIGNPIGHTKSPMIQMAFAEQTGQDLEYVAIEGKLGGFAEDVDAFRADGGRGLNITAPFKLDAFAYATKLQDGARLAGAVNCVSFDGNEATGANFDGVGLTRDIVANLGFPMKGKRVLLLGAGGAVRGALLPFLEQDPAELVLVNRTVPKANALGEQFASYGTLIATGYEQLAQERGQYDIVVNATSASLHGQLPPVPASVFRSGCLAYELLYGKGLTPFLRLAQGAGVQHLADGVGMLLEQAAEAFEWWRGIRPDTAPMMKKLTVPLV